MSLARLMVASSEFIKPRLKQRVTKKNICAGWMRRQYLLKFLVLILVLAGLAGRFASTMTAGGRVVEKSRPRFVIIEPQLRGRTQAAERSSAEINAPAAVKANPVTVSGEDNKEPPGNSDAHLPNSLESALQRLPEYRDLDQTEKDQVSRVLTAHANLLSPRLIDNPKWLSTAVKIIIEEQQNLAAAKLAESNSRPDAGAPSDEDPYQRLFSGEDRVLFPSTEPASQNSVDDYMRQGAENVQPE